MSSHNQLQAVQQEIESVIKKTVDVEKALAAAELAGDGAKVDFLRKRLEQLDKKENSLREEKNILLRAQAPGQHCLPCHHLAGLPVYIFCTHRVGAHFPHHAVPSLLHSSTMLHAKMYQTLRQTRSQMHHLSTTNSICW